jgi:hypothetical protein
VTAGVLAPREIYPTSSGLNAPGLDTRIAMVGPPSGAWPSIVYQSPFSGARSAVIRGDTHLSLTGSRPATSFEITDWYYRIHILPALENLGNVVSNEVFTVGVWNAWLATSQTLNSITPAGATGISLTGQPAPPLIFTPNQQLNYTLNILPLGPPTIDASYTFTFADAEVVVLTILGSRITAWALTPDWETPVTERLGWKTDKLRAWDGSEQRRALRIAPRRAVRFLTWMSKPEKAFVENQLFGWGALKWALPIWWDGQPLSVASNPGDLVVLCDTVGRDFVAGGLAIILTDARTYEVIQILTLTATQLNLARVVVGSWSIGAKLYPVRASRLLATTRITRENGSYAALEPQFQIDEPCDWTPATGLPAYRGAPVLEDSPSVTATYEGSYERETFTIDPQTGALEVIDTAAIGFPSNSHNWFLKGKTAHSNFRALLYLLQGQLSEIWVPSYEDDLLLTADIASSDTTIQCQNSGFGLFAGVQNRKDIRIELTQGTVYYRRITGSSSIGGNAELLTISSALGVNVPANTVRRISFMALSVLATDEIAIEHQTTITGLALATTPFRGVNHDI